MTQEPRQKLVAEALSWLGTPYHHLADVKGVGVDCAMLLVRVCANVGLVAAELDPRPYAPDWHLHRGDELFLKWLEVYGTPIDRGFVQAGDVAVWRFGRTFSHGAFVVDGDGSIVHAHKDAGCVVLGRLQESELASRPVMFWRLRALDCEQEA